MQANNSNQKGNTVSKKKACLDDKPWTAAAWDRQTDRERDGQTDGRIAVSLNGPPTAEGGHNNAGCCSWWQTMTIQ